MYVQQGDCLLKQIDKSPKGLKTVKGDLMFKGQNHHHRLRGKFKMGLLDGKTYVISMGAEIFHEEHKTIKLPVGTYRLDHVQEYDHWLQESRQVID